MNFYPADLYRDVDGSVKSTTDPVSTLVVYLADLRKKSEVLHGLEALTRGLRTDVQNLVGRLQDALQWREAALEVAWALGVRREGFVGEVRDECLAKIAELRAKTEDCR